MKKWLFVCILFALVFNAFAQNPWKVSGFVKDTSGLPLKDINIKVIETQISTTSDSLGGFTLILPDQKSFIIAFSGFNFISQEFNLAPEFKERNIQIVLESTDYKLNEVLVSDKKRLESGLVAIESKLLNSIPSVGGDNIQTLVKTMPGVASGNELTSNYSVRGGNFDENLVYINGIEVLRPVLLQSGQQEGLDMANPDLVSKVDFSAGGFSVIYDDKMSSVLDIKYRQPVEFKAGATASLLGGSAYIEGTHFDKRFAFQSGFRYKNSQYLLKSLETKGEYRPNFTDFQTLLSYQPGKKISVGFLGYYANNNFLFYPEDRETSFGTILDALSLYVDFEGNENDNFKSRLGAFTVDYRLSDKCGMKWIASACQSNESVTYDIDGRYSLNQLDKQLGSSTFGDSILNLGIGRYIDHARNYFEAKVYDLRYNGWWQIKNSFVQWGLKYEGGFYSNKINEWKMIDSAGYSLPNGYDQLFLADWWNSDNRTNSDCFSAYLNSSYKSAGSVRWNAEYGLRYTYNSLTGKNLLSPRVSAGMYPGFNKNIYLRIGGGIYYQSIIFREIIDREGNLNFQTESPLSVQFTVSGDYDFRMMDRPFHFKAEIYYKNLVRMIPYSVNNIQNIYYPDQTARGYAGGIDFRLNGEFVKDAESWLSVSLMKSGIDIQGDTLGFQSLPNDHLVNVSLYFQDYVPGNERFRMYLALFFLTGSPFGPPNNHTYYAPLRIKAYRRVDIGFSMDLLPEKSNKKFFKQCLLNIEVFNLLGIYNVVSYNWLKIVPNSSIVGYEQFSSVAVPNRLSARRLNLRLIMSF